MSLPYVSCIRKVVPNLFRASCLLATTIAKRDSRVEIQEQIRRVMQNSDEAPSCTPRGIHETTGLRNQDSQYISINTSMIMRSSSASAGRPAPAAPSPITSQARGAPQDTAGRVSPAANLLIKMLVSNCSIENFLQPKKINSLSHHPKTIPSPAPAPTPSIRPFPPLGSTPSQTFIPAPTAVGNSPKIG
jgi:hypothetical protein